MVTRVADLLAAEPPGAGVVGIEREYRVTQHGRFVDFRGLLPHLNLPGGGLDPGDPNAHHLPSGVLLTADGPEAEVATPPVPLAPGSSATASAWIELGEDLLVGALPPGTGIEGYSTHLNIAVRGDVVAIAALFARRFALGMMLLLDRRDSPGLLVRPRPGRLELGGDFVAGHQLRAALTFAVAAARSCEVTVSGGVDHLPPEIAATMRTVTDRPGWFVPRTAFGPDLYDGGRDTVVRVQGRTTRARLHLATTWDASRGAAVEVSTAEERAAVDAIVEGASPIPLESLTDADAAADAAPLRSPFAQLHDRRRAGTSVTVAAMSWAAVAFEVVTADASVHVVVPRRWLAAFLRAADDGSLVSVLRDGDGARARDRGPYRDRGRGGRSGGGRGRARHRRDAAVVNDPCHEVRGTLRSYLGWRDGHG